MHEGPALEASETNRVLALADTGEGKRLLVEGLYYGIRPIAGNVFLHDVLLLLRGGGVHERGNYCKVMIIILKWGTSKVLHIDLARDHFGGRKVHCECRGYDPIYNSRFLIFLTRMGGYHREVTKQSIILGIYFMLTYTTFLSFSCIITYIAEHEEGQYSYGPLVALAVNYFTYLISLIFATAITKFKWQFQMSAIAHLINYAVYIPNLKGDWGLIMGIIGAVFGGYGAAIYWVSQGGYLMKLFKRYGIPKNEEGKYFAITNGIVYGSSLFGAIVTTFGLGYFGSSIYFTILTGLSFVSWLVCTIFLDSLQQQISPESLLSEAESSTVVALAKVKPAQVSMWVQTKTIFLNSILYYPKMSYMFIVIILDGLVSGFISTYINKLIYVDIRTNLNVGFLLMTEGVGCIFGAMLSAFLSDKFEVLNVGRAGLGALMLTASLTLANYIVEPQTMFFPMVVGVCWGFVINYLTSWESVSCAKINEGCLQSFSIVRQSQAITYICFTVAMITTNNEMDLPYFLCALAVFCVLGLVGFLVYERYQTPIPARHEAISVD